MDLGEVLREPETAILYIRLGNPLKTLIMGLVIFRLVKKYNYPLSIHSFDDAIHIAVAFVFNITSNLRFASPVSAQKNDKIGNPTAKMV